MQHYDLPEGDIYVLGKWQKVDDDIWQTDIEAIIKDYAAEELGVPHGSRIRGQLWVRPYPGTTPDDLEWAFWGIKDDFKVLEISPSLIKDLAQAAQKVLDERRWSREDLADPDKAAEVWGAAWQALRDGKYSRVWKRSIVDEYDVLDKMLQKVSPREIEGLVWERLK